MKKQREESLSKKRSLELWDSGKIDEFEVGTYKGLRDIHKFLFTGFDGYMAGELRKVDSAKGNFAFCKAIFLETNLEIIDSMPENTYDEVIEKYVTMNVLHPFMEGNGRAMSIWLDQMLRRSLALCVDWSKIDKSDYLQAMVRSPINDLEIRVLIKEALTDDISDREVYMRGIQQSHFYENLYDYDIYEIDRDLQSKDTNEEDLDL